MSCRVCANRFANKRARVLRKVRPGLKNPRDTTIDVWRNHVILLLPMRLHWGVHFRNPLADTSTWSIGFQLQAGFAGSDWQNRLVKHIQHTMAAASASILELILSEAVRAVRADSTRTQKAHHDRHDRPYYHFHYNLRHLPKSRFDAGRNERVR